MTIIYSKNQFQRSENLGTTFIYSEGFEISMKPTEVALVALMSLQASGAMLSCFYPEHACMIQTGVLTAACLLFIKVRNSQRSHMQRLNPVSSTARKVLNEASEAKGTASNQAVIKPKPQNLEIRTRALSLDERLDQLTNDFLRARFWQIIPHPTCFKRQ